LYIPPTKQKILIEPQDEKFWKTPKTKRFSNFFEEKKREGKEHLVRVQKPLREERTMICTMMLVFYKKKRYFCTKMNKI